MINKNASNLQRWGIGSSFEIGQLYDEQCNCYYQKRFLGIILLVLACLTGGGGRNPFTGIIGFFEVWFGIAYLTRTYFFFDETKLEVYHLMFGSVIAKYEFQSLIDKMLADYKDEEISSFCQEKGKRVNLIND